MNDVARRTKNEGGRKRKEDDEEEEEDESEEEDVETLKAENQRMKEELEASKEEAKERAETYERTIDLLKKEVEAYKREMKRNQELIEQSFVESNAMSKKNSLLCNKIKRLQRNVRKHFQNVVNLIWKNNQNLQSATSVKASKTQKDNEWKSIKKEERELSIYKYKYKYKYKNNKKIKHKMEDKVKGAHGRTLPGNNARRGLQTIVI